MAMLSRHVRAICNEARYVANLIVLTKVKTTEQSCRHFSSVHRIFAHSKTYSRRYFVLQQQASYRFKSTLGSEEYTAVVSNGSIDRLANLSNNTSSSSGTTSHILNDASTPVVKFLEPPPAVQSEVVNDAAPYIPAPPSGPDISSTITEQVVQTLGEPTLISQGLGGWSPVGILQNCLEYLHINCDLPWWTAIVIGTCVVRLLMFPVVVVAQRNAAKMNNNLPQMQVIQMKMTEARSTGNALLAAKYGQELMLFMTEKKLNPLKNMMVPLAQAPVFISFFMALRGMATLPLESFKTGGLYWFTNLTIADPFYILPVITCTTVLLTIELGVDGGMRADSLQMMRYFLRATPFIIFPFAMNFPAAVLCYWVTSNFISLGQVALLRYQPVRNYFKIEKLVRHDPDNLPIKKKGFVDGFKETYGNMKVAREIEDRTRVDELQFRKAGIGPIQKTYPYDPTKKIVPARTSSTATHVKPSLKK